MATRKRGVTGSFFVSEIPSFAPLEPGEAFTIVPDENGTIEVEFRFTEFYNDNKEEK